MPRFQERCLTRMRAMRQRGVPIIFVSHNLHAVQDLCDRVLVVDRGQKLCEGTPSAAIQAYRTFLRAGSESDAPECAGGDRPPHRRRALARREWHPVGVVPHGRSHDGAGLLRCAATIQAAALRGRVASRRRRVLLWRQLPHGRAGLRDSRRSGRRRPGHSASCGSTRGSTQCRSAFWTRISSTPTMCTTWRTRSRWPQTEETSG